jgi:hypothetical protein
MHIRSDLENARLCLEECVFASNWHSDEQRFEEAKRWHDMASQWQAKIERLQASQTHPQQTPA